MRGHSILEPRDVITNIANGASIDLIPHLILLNSGNRAEFRKLVLQDYHQFNSKHTFHFSEEIMRALVPQSIEGRARSGFGAFRNKEEPGKSRRYDSSIEDVVAVLGRNVLAERGTRQREIDHIAEWIDVAMSKESPLTFSFPIITSPKGREKYLLSLIDHHNGLQSHPLAGNPHLDTPDDLYRPFLHAGPALLGYIIGSRQDSAYWRGRTEEVRGIIMNRGSTEIVDQRRMREIGYRLDWLANFNHNIDPRRDPADRMIGFDSKWDIGRLRDAGVIISDHDPEIFQDNPNIVNAYVLHQRGYGLDDDHAMIFTGLAILGRPYDALRRRFNDGKPWTKQDVLTMCKGWNLADFIDTYDKCAIKYVPGGQDEELGNRIVEKLELDPREQAELEQLTTDVIYLSRMKQDTYRACPSSSQRYFGESRILKEDDHRSMQFLSENGDPTVCAFEVHMEFVGKMYDEIRRADVEGWAGQPPKLPGIRLGFHNVKSNKFQNTVYASIVQFMKNPDGTSSPVHDNPEEHLHNVA